MKKIVQHIALLAFFGCMALVGMSAHGKHEETCRQEWKAGFTTTNNLADKKDKDNEVAGDRPVSKKNSLLFSPVAGIMDFIWQ